MVRPVVPLGFLNSKHGLDGVGFEPKQSKGKSMEKEKKAAALYFCCDFPCATIYDITQLYY